MTPQPAIGTPEHFRRARARRERAEQARIEAEREAEQTRLDAEREHFAVLKAEADRLVPTPPWKRIPHDVAAAHGLTVADLIGRSRVHRIVCARQEAMARLREAGLSYPVIGRALGGRDHTTVLEGIRAHAARIANLPAPYKGRPSGRLVPTDGQGRGADA